VLELVEDVSMSIKVYNATDETDRGRQLALSTGDALCLYVIVIVSTKAGPCGLDALSPGRA
jgi:hypothetical protein